MTSPAAKKSHNDVEKKRKDLISCGIRKLNTIVPNCTVQEIKNKTLEKTYNYILELQDKNKSLLLGAAPDQQGLFNFDLKHHLIDHFFLFVFY